MPYCPKCGSGISEEMVFCPKCGAPLKGEQVSTAAKHPVNYRYEKNEKDEKHEKGEKAEKHEKQAHGFIGPLVGGLVLVLLGLMFYTQMILGINKEMIWALFFIIIGVIIIVGVIYGAMLASKRYPKA
jgi:uncharacterized membrane protein